MIRPTGRALAGIGAGLLLATAPVLFGEVWVVVWLGAISAFAVALLAEFALLPSARRIRLEVEGPATIHLGLPAALQLHASATAAMRVHAIVELVGDCEPWPWLVLDCVRDRPTRIDLPLRPRRRGVLRVPAVHLRWRGPLGLLWREQRVAGDLELKVVPDFVTARQRALRLVNSRDFQLGLRIERYVGDGSEFESLREFVPGMDRRAVDWKASARHRALLCRQFRAERNHQVVLCVDCGRLMGEPLDGLPRLDHAIHAALQLAHVCLRTGDRVGMFAFAAQGLSLTAPAAGVGALQVLQNRIAAVDYDAAETNFTRSMTELLQALRRRTLIVLFTDFVDSIAAELMVPNVQRLARRHVVLFVALRDPLLRRLAAAPPVDTEAVHRAVVAAEMEQERDVVLERIRKGGALVVDAGVDDVGAELVDRYLQQKRRELV